MNEETRNKAEELTDEAVEQAAGGISEPEIRQAKCPKCNFGFYYRAHGKDFAPSCPNCGYQFPRKGPITLPDNLTDRITMPDLPTGK